LSYFQADSLLAAEIHTYTSSRPPDSMDQRQKNRVEYVYGIDHGPEVLGEGEEWGFAQAKASKLYGTTYDVGFYSYPW